MLLYVVIIYQNEETKHRRIKDISDEEEEKQFDVVRKTHVDPVLHEYIITNCLDSYSIH